MRDIIQEAHAIAEAHNATKKSDLRLSAIEFVDTFLQANRKRITDADYPGIREQCFRIEAAALGIVSIEMMIL
jgi:hypothetical protein